MICEDKVMSKKLILKTREDRQPVHFECRDENKYYLADEQECPWAKNSQEIEPPILRSRIEPWLSALFQSEHLSLLIGTGLTYAVHGLAKNSQLPEMPQPKFSNFQNEINQAGISENTKEENTKKIETQIQVANELLVGLKHLDAIKKEPKEEIVNLETEIASFLKKFSEYILELEKGISSAGDQNKEWAFNYLVSFLTSFSSRSGTRDRLHIFTTNYDRIIEAGAEVAGLHLLDRFVGNLSPIFRSSRLENDMHYNPPGIRGEPRYLEGVVRFSKMHGSIDWIYVDRDIRRIGLPFGSGTIDSFLKAFGIQENNFSKLMIYPNAAKDKETTAYPYVELFRDFAASICRPNSALVTYGYSYGDDHINRVIEDMLTIPSTHLVIISHGDPEGRIMNIYDKIGRPAQITLLIGEAVAGLKPLVDNYLPKAAIDRITSRMTDLLKSRPGVAQNENGNEEK